jgi:DNA helicase INO80
MLVYWKKYEKVEKEHRKKAEKEAIEQRKIDFEMNEVIERVILHVFFH